MFNPLVSIYFESSRLEYKIQTNCITFQTVDPEIYSILIFFSVTSASTTFRIWYFKKIFLILYSNNWANFIVCLLLLLEMLNNMGIVIFCFPVDDVINFETWPYLSYQVIFLHDKENQENLKNKKKLSRWNKTFYRNSCTRLS